MSRDEWFRRTAWTEHDREEFNARVRRCRGSKSQYLRIQAFHLAEAGHDRAALELLDRLFSDSPERTELACAHLQKAECLARLGDDPSAIESFRAALDMERSFPKVRTSAWLDFGCFVMQKALTSLYDEVERIFDEFSAVWHLPLPIEKYRYFAVRAYLAERKGSVHEARDFAQLAIAEAKKEHSGLRYHPKLGLVGDGNSQFTSKLKALATSNISGSRP